MISFDKNLNESEIKSVQQNDATSKYRYVRRFMEWFCGLESTSSTTATPSIISTPKQKMQLRDMTSLHQTPHAQAALCIALIFLVTLDVFLYIFFGTGSNFGLLRNDHNSILPTVGTTPSAGNQLLLNLTLNSLS